MYGVVAYLSEWSDPRLLAPHRVSPEPRLRKVLGNMATTHQQESSRSSDPTSGLCRDTSFDIPIDTNPMQPIESEHMIRLGDVSQMTVAYWFDYLLDI